MTEKLDMVRLTALRSIEESRSTKRRKRGGVAVIPMMVLILTVGGVFLYYNHF